MGPDPGGGVRPPAGLRGRRRLIAVDTNILIYAHREETDLHAQALAAMRGLAEGSSPWAIPWPCVHEFLAIVTHPGIFRPPTPSNLALDAIEAWTRSETCRLIGEGPGYLDRLRRLVEEGRLRGARVHEARIAAVCLHNGVKEIWTVDRDFSRLRGLKAVNPLLSR